MHNRIDSRLQPIYRVAHRFPKFVYLLPIRSLPKRITDSGTKYPEVHAILIVGHLVLTTSEPGISYSWRGTKLTLIVVRRIAEISKTAGAGVMLAASFPMLTRPMATSSDWIASSRHFGCLDLSAMVETQGDCEGALLGKIVRKIPNAYEEERPSLRGKLCAAGPTEAAATAPEDAPDRATTRRVLPCVYSMSIGTPIAYHWS